MRAGRFPTGIVLTVTAIVGCSALVAVSAPPPARTGAVAADPTATTTSAASLTAAIESSAGAATSDVLSGTASEAGSGTGAGTGSSAAQTGPPSAIPDTIPWPQATEAAVTIAGSSNITTHGATGPVPIASLAKVMTAYVILTDHPLADSSQGPVITVTADDAAEYTDDLAAGGSAVEVRAGERITERQALEAMLLHSANNLAVLFATWDAGSVSAFVGRMNRTASALGLASTHYADPAGLDPRTVSTASDQVKLALVALRLPAFAETVALTSATVPVAGTLENYDTMLGVDGIVGVKTGYTDAAGGTMVVAAWSTAGSWGGLDETVHPLGRRALIVGAVLGVPGSEAVSFGRTLDAGDELVSGVERWLED